MNEFKIGDKVHLKEGQNSWSMNTQTLIVVAIEGKWIYAKRKGGSNASFPYYGSELQKLSNNPFVRIKRMFCRTFECSYK